MDSGYNLKTELVGFTARLTWRGARERVGEDSRIWAYHLEAQSRLGQVGEPTGSWFGGHVLFRVPHGDIKEAGGSPSQESGEGSW